MDFIGGSMSLVKISVDSFMNRLSLKSVDLELYEHLEVTRKVDERRVNVRVSPEFFLKNREASKRLLNRVRELARKEGLKAEYEPRGRWLYVGPK